MELWQALLTGGGIGSAVTALGSVLLALLRGKKSSDRADLMATNKEWKGIAHDRQDVIDNLRRRLDEAEVDIRECLADRAALRQRIEDLEQRGAN